MAATKRAMAIMERTMEEQTQSERSYTASYGRSVAATERAMTAMKRIVAAIEDRLVEERPQP